ncbi:transcription factor bHLH18-like [Phoenix dactylifera]|uniref:Transcription factor bHLH18-like n=1 Tax=Phoenix dactylifera TaxID=42345 RepID=A0A8B7BUN5_PHODC|nr:transcription factor bHLH18-like [Phoenix dactylifera]XP_038990068.1 transcription factor bHLH18-like [Phoenix dactylifera]
MDTSVARWFHDMGMEDPSFFHQWDVDSLDQFSAQQIAVALGQDFQRSLSSESYASYPSFQPPASTISNTSSCSYMDTKCVQRPKKVLKANSWNSCTTEQNSSLAPGASSPSILSFGNPGLPRHQSDLYESFVGAVKTKEEMEILVPPGSKRSYGTMVEQGPKRMNMGARPASHNQDHIIAERKRREKMGQRFIALSALLPGLKKMDKASVLGDAIEYVKQLQEKVKTLEEQNTKRTVESAVLVKKPQLSSEDDGSSWDENCEGLPSGESLPEIEAKMSENSVLVKIYCEKRSGVLLKALSEIEKLHLNVINASVIPFASSHLDITVVAQIDADFSMTVKDVVKKLNSAFRQFM